MEIALECVIRGSFIMHMTLFLRRSSFGVGGAEGVCQQGKRRSEELLMFAMVITEMPYVKVSRSLLLCGAKSDSSKRP